MKFIGPSQPTSTYPSQTSSQGQIMINPGSTQNPNFRQFAQPINQYQQLPGHLVPDHVGEVYYFLLS